MGDFYKLVAGHPLVVDWMKSALDIGMGAQQTTALVASNHSHLQLSVKALKHHAPKLLGALKVMNMVVVEDDRRVEHCRVSPLDQQHQEEEYRHKHVLVHWAYCVCAEISPASSEHLEATAFEEEWDQIVSGRLPLPGRCAK